MGSSGSEARQRSWFGRLLLWGTAAVVLLFGIFLVVSYYSNRAAKAHLDEVIARLDCTDPNWRLHDLDKDVPPLPDDKNSVLVVKQILKEKPANWPSADVQQQIGNPDPKRQLTPAQMQALKKELDRSPATLALVRKLANFEGGYLKINWPPDVIGATLPLVQESREVAAIAKYDAQLRAQEGDYDGALESCRACLIAGRSSEPANTLIQMLVRFAIEAICLNEVERTLAQGEPSVAALTTLQNLLEDEASRHLFVDGVRGERAMSFAAIDFIFKNSKGKTGLIATGAFPMQTKNDLLSRALGFVLAPFTGSAEANQALCLQTLTELIEAMKLPEAEQAPIFARIDALAKDWRQPALFRLLLPAVSKVREAHLRNQARLRCSVLGIAAERYRRQHGAWPDKLDLLVPHDAPQIEVDPYTGAPLFLRRVDDGLVVYSVGPNRVDDGGKVGQTGTTPDIGFRLWDVSARRQKPADPTPSKPEE
jgi:hypothetical protein